MCEICTRLSVKIQCFYYSELHSWSHYMHRLDWVLSLCITASIREQTYTSFFKSPHLPYMVLHSLPNEWQLRKKKQNLNVSNLDQMHYWDFCGGHFTFHCLNVKTTLNDKVGFKIEFTNVNELTGSRKDSPECTLRNTRNMKTVYKKAQPGQSHSENSVSITRTKMLVVKKDRMKA